MKCALAPDDQRWKPENGVHPLHSRSSHPSGADLVAVLATAPGEVGIQEED